MNEVSPLVLLLLILKLFKYLLWLVQEIIVCLAIKSNHHNFYLKYFSSVYCWSRSVNVSMCFDIFPSTDFIFPFVAICFSRVETFLSRDKSLESVNNEEFWCNWVLLSEMLMFLLSRQFREKFAVKSIWATKGFLQFNSINLSLVHIKGFKLIWMFSVVKLFSKISIFIKLRQPWTSRLESPIHWCLKLE